jgi:hypothetical protein
LDGTITRYPFGGRENRQDRPGRRNFEGMGISSMKKLVTALSEETLSMYPINDLVEGWYFRFTEISNGAYRVEGIDKWGHSVSRQCSEPALDATLKACANDAQGIEKQLKDNKI